MQVLVKLIASYDTKKIITSASKDAGILAKKRELWEKITEARTQLCIVYAHSK